MSNDEREVTRGGSRVIRHQAAADGAPLAHGDEATIAAVVAHVEGHLGTVASVWHELVSEWVHLDVHAIAASEAHEAITLFTTGMSDLPMAVDDAAADAPAHVELMLRLPPDWQLGDAAFADERWYWPVRWLKELARLPHQYATWLGWGHTIPNGDPPAPLAPGVPFTGFVIAPPTCLDEDAATVVTAARATTILAIYPLHPDEMTFKLEHGADALFECMDKAGVTDRIDLRRPSVVPKRTRRR